MTWFHYYIPRIMRAQCIILLPMPIPGFGVSPPGLLAEKVLFCPHAKACRLIPCVLDAGHLRFWYCREGTRAAFCCPVGFICQVVFLSSVARYYYIILVQLYNVNYLGFESCFAHSRASYLCAFHPPSFGTAGHRNFLQDFDDQSQLRVHPKAIIACTSSVQIRSA
jgi:hypothetical protein